MKPVIKSGSYIKVGIIGGSGYTGAELLRLLSYHPYFQIDFITGHSEAGKKLVDLYPHLDNVKNYSSLIFQKFPDIKDSIKDVNLLFFALPHGESMSLIKDLYFQYYASFPNQSLPKIIDLSSDFRIQDLGIYSKWYNKEHVAPELNQMFQYGLPELFKEKIQKSTFIANPGCYATSIILSFAPLVNEGIIESTLIASSISGTSGAGKALSNKLLFSNLFEDISSYKVASHQHTGEIEQTLNYLNKIKSEENKLTKLKDKDYILTMIPHLAPISRGIHSTCIAKLSSEAIDNISQEKILSIFKSFYKNDPFIRISDNNPSTKTTRGSNAVIISPVLDSRNNNIVICTVLDNLVKGASGAAIQNANILFDFDETLGLNFPGLYP